MSYWDFVSGALLEHRGLVHVVYFNKGALIRFMCSRFRDGKLAARAACHPKQDVPVTCFECLMVHSTFYHHAEYVKRRAKAVEQEFE